jgi:YVTN family beta-propeller protein
MTRATRWVIVLVVLVLAIGAAAAVWLRLATSHRGHIFVANYKDDSVSVIDMEEAREVKVLPVGDSPFAFAFCAAQPPVVAVTNSTAHRVTFIDPATLDIVGAAPASKGPEFAACSPDGARLYVTSPYDKTITIIDVASRAAARDPFPFERQPGAIALSPDGARIYVLMRDEHGEALALDAATGAVQARAPVGRFPSDLARTADGRRLIAASFDDDTITVIDADGFAVLRTIELDTGRGLVVHPIKPIVYSMDGFNDTIAVVDYESGKQLPSIECAGGPTYSAITPDGRFLYAVNEDASNVTKIDTESGERVLRVAVGRNPVDALIVE